MQAAAVDADPDARAAALIARATEQELLILARGHVSALTRAPPGDYERANGLGFVLGLPRLGVPVQRQIDGQMGVGDPAGNTPSAEATQFPSGLAVAASWRPDLAEETGAAIGREARAKGFNVLLAGAVNLIRDPRCGRCCEYPGEDPLLAGVIVGHFVRGAQSARGLIATVKHFALNAYENGRMQHNVVIDRAAAMESDLLAFRIAIAVGDPGATMASYNAVNGAFASENKWLLTDILRGLWRFEGWVMSDFGGAHSAARAALAGLDQESACESDRIVALGGMALLNMARPSWLALARIASSLLTGDIRRRAWFGRSLAKAVARGDVPQSRLREMAQRILRTLAKHGALDAPERGSPVDIAAHAALARRVARAGIVLLKNEGPLLPLGPKLKSVAVIGARADIGLPSAGGTALVLPVGGNAVPTGRGRLALLRTGAWARCAPLGAIVAKAPDATVSFADGADAAAAERLARASEIAIVFAYQQTREGRDQVDLSLADGQDALIARVAAANPRTIVVLSCGGPVAMPWAAATPAILCAWYSGQRGAEAVADVLFGDAEPAGRLPVTFPNSVDDLPRPRPPQPPAPRDGAAPQYDLRFDEGAEVGYRWFERRGLPVLFPFGHGLSYTTFRYESVVATAAAGDVAAVVSLANVGDRAGVEIAQLYVENPQAGAWASPRLGGWARVELAPGARAQVSIRIPAFIFGRWDEAAGCWRIDGGPRRLRVGSSCRDVRLETTVRVEPATAPP